jgi:hypothetical protein
MNSARPGKLLVAIGDWASVNFNPCGSGEDNFKKNLCNFTLLLLSPLGEGEIPFV